MRITKSKLRQIIREEAGRLLEMSAARVPEIYLIRDGYLMGGSTSDEPLPVYLTRTPRAPGTDYYARPYIDSLSELEGGWREAILSEPSVKAWIASGMPVFKISRMLADRILDKVVPPLYDEDEDEYDIMNDPDADIADLPGGQAMAWHMKHREMIEPD